MRRDLTQVRGHERVVMRARDASDPALALLAFDDVDDAAVGENRHRQLRDGSQGRLVVERHGEHRPGFGKQLLISLDLLPLRRVAQHDRQEQASRKAELRDRRLGGKLDAALSQARHLSAVSHQPRRFGTGRECSDVRRVRGAETFRQQHHEWLADDFRRGIAEDLFGPAIEVDDLLRLVDRYDRVGRYREDSLEPRFERAGIECAPFTRERVGTHATSSPSLSASCT